MKEFAWLLVCIVLLFLVHALAKRCESNENKMNQVAKRLEAIEKKLDYGSKADWFLLELKSKGFTNDMAK